MQYKQILCEVSERILTITLNRPEQYNTASSVLISELVEAFNMADANDDVRAVIVTGAGRFFCAGADLSSGAKTWDYSAQGVPKAPVARRDGGGLVTLRIFEMKKPVIAAINGPAVGFGLTMTLPMDIRLASEKARMGFVFTRRGVIPEACSTWFLPRIIGITKAAELTLTGRILEARKALEYGLLTEVLAPEDLLPRAREIASEIVENTSATSVALCRQLLWRMLGADHPMEAHKMDSRIMSWTGERADAHEGVMSFLEKRPPKFSMKPSTDMPDFYPWWTDKPFA